MSVYVNGVCMCLCVCGCTNVLDDRDMEYREVRVDN